MSVSERQRQRARGRSRFPAHIPVIGGLAADNDRITRTWVLHAGRPQPEVAAAVGLYGDRAQMTHGARGGCESFGPERVVTRSQGKILFELAGRPALTFY